MIKGIRRLVSPIWANIYIRYIAATIFFCFLTALLFYNNYAHGLQFDEVFRVNNLIPFFNPYAEPYEQSIFSISILSASIPIAYKSYISSAALLPYIPIFLWEDYLIGLRTLYAVSFCFAIIIFFIILSRFVDLKYSFLTSLLLATSPILFPEIRFGFAYSLHIVFLSIAFYLLYLFNRDKKTMYLFAGSFLLFVGANIYFYFLWVITSLIITSFIFYQDFWKEIILSLKNIFALVSGFVLGFINFVLYNISSGFPSVKPLIIRIFFQSEYELNPIDYKPSSPLFEEISGKFDIIYNFFGGYGYIYLAIGIITLIIFGLITIKLVRQDKLGGYKNYYFCLVNVLLILAFILITPNTTRAGHYSFLIPFLELTILSLVMLLMKIYRSDRVHVVGVAILVILISLNSFVTGTEITQSIEDRGKGYFSPAIFDLNKYFDENQIDSKSIVFVQWGMYSQLYFLNKGEFKINSLVFQMLGAEDSQRRADLLERYIVKHHMENKREEIYFPMYRKGSKTLKTEQIYKDINDTLSLHSGELDVIATFNETNGEPLIYLYKLSNADVVVDNILRRSIPTYECGAAISFGRDGTAQQYQAVGWSDPEEGFTWTNGLKAVLAVQPKNTDSDLTLTITASPYLGGGAIEQQRVNIKANGHQVGEWVFDRPGTQEKTIVIPHVVLEGEIQYITFELPDAVSPKDLRQSGDVRILGLAIHSMVIDGSDYNRTCISTNPGASPVGCLTAFCAPDLLYALGTTPRQIFTISSAHLLDLRNP